LEIAAYAAFKGCEIFVQG